MKIKNLLVLTVFLVGMLAFSGFASALDLNILEVELDRTELDPSGLNTVYSFEKGQEMEVRVQFEALNDLDDVELYVFLTGIDLDGRVYDSTNVFSAKANRVYTKKLTLELPDKMDRDEYKLRVEVAGRNTDTVTETYNLEVETDRHNVEVRDVVLSPSNGVKAGRALLATVRVNNFGETEENDVKVTFSIPELGVSASDYIDELEEDGEEDQKSTEELYLRIPVCADAGVYDAVVEVRFHDGDRVERKTMPVEVIADETCGKSSDSMKSSGKSTITVGPESQDIAKGGSAVYPVTITNGGNAKTYVVSVTGGDFGSFSVSPSNVVTVGRDETKTVYVQASVNSNAPSGTQVFGVDIQSGDSVVSSVTLQANVVGGSTGSVDLKRALEIGLIVLVVILVILGLIIGFNKLKEDDDKTEGETYY